MRIFLLLLIGSWLSLAAASSANAEIIWNMTFQDVAQNKNVGFNDPTLGAIRRATLYSAANYISSVIDADGTIDMDIQLSQTDGAGFLGTAGTTYSWPSGTTGFVNGWVYRHATTGIDPSGSTSPDGFAQFDFGYNWNSDLSAPAFEEYDLFSVALHELSHSLGFASVIDPDGTSGFGGNPPIYTTFDKFLTDALGNPLINAAGNFVASTSVLTSGNVFFKTATGALIEMYAPNPFRPGSSLSHVDLDDSVMSFSIANGEMQRTYSADELAILSTLGYNVQVAAVPEPASLVLLSATAVGFGICRLRRRRSVETTISA